MQQTDIKALRRDFPILNQQVNGCPLVYFDNAATTQKPRAVMDAIEHYYAMDNANVHRGVHALSARATAAFEQVREQVRTFINAPFTQECLFVRGTTEAINLVAHSFALPRLQPGDEILVTQMEHHANIVPWQMVCQKTGAVLRVAPITSSGEVMLDSFENLISSRTKIVAMTHVSNALGTINPVKQMIEIARAYGAVTVVDGAQATPHLSIDVQDLGCDFYAFSGHKMYAPTGIGVLWGRQSILSEMPPYQGGGEMIQYVTFEKTEYAAIPARFEAGTPNIEGVIGLGAALTYLSQYNMVDINAYEETLLAYLTQKLSTEPGFRLIGTAEHKVPVVSFVHESIHAHDIGTILDSAGIAIRSGHHCAMPLMDFYGVPATTRISLSFYNTIDEVDQCIQALRQAVEVFS